MLEREDKALRSVRTNGRTVTSALTMVETARAILRARVSGRLTPAQERAAVRALRRFERRCYVVAVSETVLARAQRPFPIEPIQTLDAVHLASCLIFTLLEGARLPFVTADARQRAAAERAQLTVVWVA